jgi:hypothetical protein
MSRESELTIGFALVIAMGCGVSSSLLPSWTLRIGVLARRARRSCRPPIGSSRRRNHPK